MKWLEHEMSHGNGCYLFSVLHADEHVGYSSYESEYREDESSQTTALTAIN